MYPSSCDLEILGQLEQRTELGPRTVVPGDPERHSPTVARWRLGRAIIGRVTTPFDGPALSVDHLSKRFGDRLAFDDVSFEVRPGEVFGFLGPNGAGKTTMVRTLGTLLTPTSGSATVAGLPLSVENGVEIRRRISVMPESPGLYTRLSVAENLECFAGLYELADPRATDRTSARCGQPRRPGQRPVRNAVEGTPPTGQPRPGAPERPATPLPGRADGRPRSRGGPRRPRADQRAARAGGHDLPDDPPARRGRAAVQPGRDPQHPTPDDRHAGGAAGPALREDAHRPDGRSIARSQAPLCAASRRSTRGAGTNPVRMSFRYLTRRPRRRSLPGRSWPPGRTSCRSRNPTTASRTSTSS